MIIKGLDNETQKINNQINQYPQTSKLDSKSWLQLLAVLYFTRPPMLFSTSVLLSDISREKCWQGLKKTSRSWVPSVNSHFDTPPCEMGLEKKRNLFFLFTKPNGAFLGLRQTLLFPFFRDPGSALFPVVSIFEGHTERTECVWKCAKGHGSQYLQFVCEFWAAI